MADAHLDGILPLAVLDAIESGMADSSPSAESSREVLRQVRARLVGRVPLGGSQLDRAAVRGQLRKVVEEYVSSHDVAEVLRRLKELALPYDLQHELVCAEAPAAPSPPLASLSCLRRPLPSPAIPPFPQPCLRRRRHVACPLRAHVHSLVHTAATYLPASARADA